MPPSPDLNHGEVFTVSIENEAIKPQILAMAAMIADLDRMRLEENRPGFARWAEDPVAFITDCLKETLWSRQATIARALRDHRRVAVPSCHDAGKSFLASRLVAWWVATRPAGQSFVVTSAPTFAQVRAILWREIRAAHRKGKLPGALNRTEWWINGALVAFGRKPADDDMTSFQGIHAKHVLVVFDEACGVPQPLWDAAETLIANAESKLFAIGNPDDPASAFARACRPGSGWEVLPIDALETPNLTGEVIPDSLRDLLISAEWVADKRRHWGESSALYLAKVRGQFPEVGGDGLLSPALVRAAMNRAWSPGEPVRVGVDVARFGRDRSVLTLRRGSCLKVLEVLEGVDTMRVAGAVAQALRQHVGAAAIVDEIGLGAGVLDRLREQGLPAFGVNVARPAQERERFVNRRAELWWALRERFVEGEIALDPQAKELAAELTGLRWSVDSRGRIAVESKEAMRRRGEASPDLADAAMLAFAEADAVKTPFFYIGGSK
ncbi:MAG: hypothetical protein ACOVVK_20775 [Elsteraceae bacterium]